MAIKKENQKILSNKRRMTKFRQTGVKIFISLEIKKIMI